jgi:hypothetical protein
MLFMIQRPGKNRDIFKAFRRGEFYEDLYQKYEIDEKDLINILQHNIKGSYDYSRILNGGESAQQQFISHLNNRWNPLEPNSPWKSVNPYGGGKKIPVPKEEKEQ